MKHKKNLIKSAKGRVTGTIQENCPAYLPMILKEFCSSNINGLVMKTFSGK